MYPLELAEQSIIDGSSSLENHSMHYGGREVDSNMTLYYFVYTRSSILHAVTPPSDKRTYKSSPHSCKQEIHNYY